MNPRRPERPRTKERRSLSTVAAPGRIDTGGDPELAHQLADALREGRDREVNESLTHPLHTYPARMHPGTARRLIDVVMEGRPYGTLIDPFCGSGTTLVEARAAGARAIGVDLNPLAVTLARAKTWTAPLPRRRALRDVGQRIAGEVLAEGKQARRSGHEPAPLRAPAGFDPNARNRRLARWFAPHVRRELELIATHIEDVRADDPEIAEALTAALSAILYKVSSRASDTDPTWVERHVARGAAARLFAQRVELLFAGLDEMTRVRGETPQVIEADARTLVDRLGAGAAAGVVTSPPYAGTYDYAEQHRLRFDFLGIRHRAFDEGEIGARRSFDGDDRRGPRPDPRHQWRQDLAAVVDMIGGLLVPGGRAALVIGDSIAGGRAMYADDDVRGTLGDDLALAAWASQTRPTLGAGERRAFGERPKREHVILLVRR